MKIFVTGTSGFIGSSLVPALRLQGHDIHCMTSDLLEFHQVEQEVIDCAPDVILHLAARTEVEASFYEQTSFSSVNYVGTVNLIEAACKLSRRPFFLFASTMEVYGWQPISDRVQLGGRAGPEHAFDETTPCHPNAPYAVAKYACERYLEYAARTRQLKYVMLRQTNAFGRDKNDFFVTEQIISQMLRDANECQLGYKLPYRNFIYRDDVVAAWISIINNLDRCTDQIFCIGPNHPVRIEDHAHAIAELLDWKGQIIWDTKPQRPGEIFYLCSRHDRLTEATGWSPKVSYRDGLAHTIKMWRQRLGA
jgi:GDP-4-dehydro-6-deoxy-D-mannose reductase